MIVWQSGTVEEIVSEREAVQEVNVSMHNGDIKRALHYTDVLRPLVVGDRVSINATADALRLGSGGHCFVYGIEGEAEPPEHPSNSPSRPGHIMKLRYTPQQRAVLSVEEADSPHHDAFVEPATLDGMPVLIGELHSMVPIVCAWLKGSGRSGDMRISYVMTDGGALPIAYSKHVCQLQQKGWLCGTVTYGHAYGGDLEAVNKYTALLAARRVQSAHIAIAAMGPGIVGTGTPFGHTAVEMAELIHAVHALGGVPIVIPRISFADLRKRHSGLSHHLLQTLGKLTLARSVIPLPNGLNEREKQTMRSQLASSGCDARHEIVWVPDVTLDEVERRLHAYDARITTMGRGLCDDPAFFAAVCAAAQAAAFHVQRRQ